MSIKVRLDLTVSTRGKTPLHHFLKGKVIALLGKQTHKMGGRTSGDAGGWRGKGLQSRLIFWLLYPALSPQTLLCPWSVQDPELWATRESTAPPDGDGCLWADGGSRDG